MNYFVMFFRSERTREEIIQAIEADSAVKEIDLFLDYELEDMNPAYAVSFNSDNVPNKVDTLLEDIGISEGYASECFQTYA